MIWVETTAQPLDPTRGPHYCRAVASLWGSRYPWYQIKDLWSGFAAKQDQTATNRTTNNSPNGTVTNINCVANVLAADSLQREKNAQLTYMMSQISTTDVCFCNV